ncbi:MAG: hypothetical protein ACRD2L_24525, partial [Terriglobia bacterium]
SSAPSDSQAQGSRSRRIDYSRFKHSSHAGAIKASRKGTVQQIDCAYCHGTLTNENPDVVRGYPYRKYGLKNELTHSACSDCHAFTGRDAIVTGSFPAMCTICHQDSRLARMGKNLRAFPNPAVAESQFFDRYSHEKHTGYFEASDIFKDRFKDKEKFKEADNFECAACHTNNQKTIVVAKIEFAPGVKQSLPGHQECFVCHFNEKEVPKEQPTLFATNCAGCHAAKREQTGKGSEPSVHWFVRQIVNNEKNLIQPKPGEEPTKPFSHKTHLEDEDDKSTNQCLDCQTKKCLECHVTGKRAEKRSDFFLEDRETKEKQPRAAGCVQCHKKDMEQKIEGAVKLETSKCSYCHSLQSIKEKATSGVQLPPPNHFGKKAVAMPATLPKPQFK